MDWLTDPQAWIALITLFALELVLGVDNVIFISILAGKLPADQRPRALTAGKGRCSGVMQPCHSPCQYPLKRGFS